MQKGPKPAELLLREQERKELEALVRRHSTPQQVAKRARIVLAAAEGKRNAEIARDLEVSVDMARTLRGRGIGLQPVPLRELEVGERVEDLAPARRPAHVHPQQRS